MNFKLTIGRKIGLGFGILIVLIVVVFGATYFAINDGIKTFESSNKTSNVLIESITPSKEKISKLSSLTNDSKQFAIQWVNVQSGPEMPFKTSLKIYIDRTIPKIITDLEILSISWENEENVKLLKTAIKDIDELFIIYNEIINYLPDFASYDDVFFFFARELIGQDSEFDKLSNQINFSLRNLRINFENQEERMLEDARKTSAITNEKFQNLTFYWILGTVLIFLSIFIAAFTTNSIVKPVKFLKIAINKLSKGVIPKKPARESNDEIGEMSAALNQLIKGTKKTTEFAREVGQSKFDSYYEPLSEDDELGQALLVMRDELEETERNLERKVEERTEEVVKQRNELDKQNLKLEELYKDVTDSIVYAKRLQNTILPSDDKISQICPNSFVLYKPKDIVSGDFYWFEKANNKSLFSVVDCTGHGVPGAFMSLLGANGLNSALKEGQLDCPAKILDYLNKSIHEALNKDDSGSEINDGMDVAICSIDYNTLILEYSGANNPLYIVRDGEFLITKSDKMAIGSFQPGTMKYQNHSIQLQKGDVVYIFSDGYPDQFGGPRGRKLMYNNFRDSLLSINQESLEKQRDILDQKLIKWQGKMDQVDDVLVIGLKV